MIFWAGRRNLKAKARGEEDPLKELKNTEEPRLWMDKLHSAQIPVLQLSMHEKEPIQVEKAPLLYCTSSSAASGLARILNWSNYTRYREHLEHVKRAFLSFLKVL